MALVESLPPRPLSPKELTGLNAADAFELAVSVESEGVDEARSLLLATDAWVKGLAFDGSSWTVVETASLDGRERIEGLQSCEDAIRAFREESEGAEKAEEVEEAEDAERATDAGGDDAA